MGLADRAIKVSRRGMLQTGAVTAVIYAASSGTCLFPVADNAWAAESRGLSQQERATLMRFTRDLFPHDQLVDTFYANAIAALDAEAAKDPAARALLAKGVQDLDTLTMKGGGKRFAATRHETKRIAAIKEIEGSPFFTRVYGGTRTGLYNNAAVWPIFGFEGPSSPEGGYLHRGFGDLDWL